MKHCYLRHAALLAQLRTEGGGGTPGAGAPLLRRLLAAAGAPLEPAPDAGPAPGMEPCLASPASSLDSHAVIDGSGGRATPAGSFEAGYCREVGRLRLLLSSALEQLWLALLDACGQLLGAGEELLQVGWRLAGVCSCGSGPVCAAAAAGRCVQLRQCAAAAARCPAA